MRISGKDGTKRSLEGLKMSNSQNEGKKVPENTGSGSKLSNQMDSDIDASILIIAYRKRPYIMDALKSALNQDYNRDKYEIILVKNFMDDEIEKYCEDNYIKIINSSETKLGSKICEGTTIARGKYILLLEDDDMFTPDKVRKVIDIFNNNDVGFIHNSYYILDELETKGKIREEELELKNKEKILGLYNLRNLDRTYLINDSSISIKKEIIMNAISYVQNSNTEFPELLLAYATLVQNMKLYISKEKLTYYRLHENNTSIGKDSILSLCLNVDSFFNNISNMISDLSRNNNVLLKNLEAYKQVRKYECSMLRFKKLVNPLNILKDIIKYGDTYSRRRLSEDFLASFILNILNKISTSSMDLK